MGTAKWNRSPVWQALSFYWVQVLVAANSLREIAQGAVNRPLPSLFTLGVLLFVVVVKETLFRATHARNREVESCALESDAWHHRSDALTSLAAAIGIVIGFGRWSEVGECR
jgi:divalent metal cation (Fe/Co/Zn/Cd) transporter